MHGYQRPDYPFRYDEERHKGFKHASRHIIHHELKKSNKSSQNSLLILSSENAELLRSGLSAADMDDRWEGNLADSKANKKSKELVVRLYRSWTACLIFEARYRPQGQENVLTLYEFAFEADKKVYHCHDLEYELQEYGRVLRNCILATINARKPKPDPTEATNEGC